MLRAWREALDVPQHKGFRLLEYMMQRFVALCGGDTLRTAGSVEIKRKYMKNMVQVISQFNANVASSAGSSDRRQWFELKRSERKKCFTQLNTKSYKFANISEEAYHAVHELMAIEDVVYGSGSKANDNDAEEGDEEEEASAAAGGGDECHGSVVRVTLVKSSDGGWETRRAARGLEPLLTTSPPPAPTANTSHAMKVEAVRQDAVFDQLVSTALDGGGDAVMIDVASDGEDGYDSDSSSANDDKDDDDNDLWGDAKPAVPLHLRHRSAGDGPASPRISYHRHRHIPVNAESDVVRHSAAWPHEVPSTASSGSQQEELTNPELLKIVSDLETQAQQLKAHLDQVRSERVAEQTDRENDRQKRESVEVQRILEQLETSHEELRIQREQRSADDEEQRQIAEQILLESEARQRDEEERRHEEEEKRAFLELLRLDREDRERFREECKAERAEKAKFLRLIQQDQEERRQEVQARSNFLEQMKQFQVRWSSGSDVRKQASKAEIGAHGQKETRGMSGAVALTEQAIGDEQEEPTQRTTRRATERERDSKAPMSTRTRSRQKVQERKK